MARLVCRCPWCHRTAEVEVAVVAIERWVAEEGSRPRAYRERKKVKETDAERGERKFQEWKRQQAKDAKREE